MDVHLQLEPFRPKDFLTNSLLLQKVQLIGLATPVVRVGETILLELEFDGLNLEGST